MDEIRGKRLGEVLASIGIISKEELKAVLSVQRLTNQPLGEILIDLEYADEDVILTLIGKHCGAPFIRLSEVDGIDYTLLKRIPDELLTEEFVFPFREEDDSLAVAMANPDDIEMKQKLEEMFGMSIKPYITSKSEIQGTIKNFQAKRSKRKKPRRLKKQKVKA